LIHKRRLEIARVGRGAGHEVPCHAPDGVVRSHPAAVAKSSATAGLWTESESRFMGI